MYNYVQQGSPIKLLLTHFRVLILRLFSETTMKEVGEHVSPLVGFLGKETCKCIEKSEDWLLGQNQAPYRLATWPERQSLCTSCQCIDLSVNPDFSWLMPI